MQEPVNILQINTALHTASVAIARDGQVLAERINTNQYEHASFVQPAVLEVCQESGLSIDDLQAVAVVNGPGSYTGLRVGLASAKGICFAKQLPLICINTLDWMAGCLSVAPGELICAMIDARRNEVFTAMYDHQGKVLILPQAMVLEEASFAPWLEASIIHFIGDGAEKWSKIVQHAHAAFPAVAFTATVLAQLSHKAFSLGQFSDLAYAEPFYTKDFYSTQIK